MSKESIIAFSQAKAEPLWLQDLRQAAFDKLESLALPKIERVKFHRWNLGDGTITEMNHQQMCLILQRLETTLNWSK